MQRQLLVLRHGKSSWADAFTDDWERPLTERGERDAVRVGEFLRRQGLVPDLIVSSDAVRAQSTAQRAADASGYSGTITLSSLLYHATPAAITGVINGVINGAPNAVHRLMIVGHNPGLEDLVSQLTRQQIGLSTATLVHIELPVEHWHDAGAATAGSLLGFWNPRDL